MDSTREFHRGCQKGAEKTPGSKLSHHAAILEEVSDIVTEVNADRIYTWMNRAGLRFFGEDAIGKDARSYFEGDQDTLRTVQPLFEGDLDFICVESWQRRRDGQTRLLAWRFRPLVDERGAVAGAVATGCDITQQHEMEVAHRLARRVCAICNRTATRGQILQEIVSELQAFTGCQAIRIRLMDEAGAIGFHARAGFTEAFHDRENPPSAKTGDCRSVDVIKGVTHSTFPFYTPGGSFYMNGATRFLATASQEDRERLRTVCDPAGCESIALIPLRSSGKVLGLIHVADPRENMVPLHRVQTLEDIAAQMSESVRRVLVEEELRGSEERYRALVDHSPDTVLIECEGKIVFINPAGLLLLGASHPKEILGRDILSLVPPDFRERTAERMVIVRDQRRTVPHREGQLVRLDGNPVDVDVTAVPATFEGKPAAHLIVHDITEHKQAESALRANEEKYRNCFDNAPVGMFRSMADGSRILDVNAKLLEILGFSREEAVGARSAICWADIRDREAAIRELEEAGCCLTHGEYRWLNKQGEIRICLVSLRLYSGQGIVEGSVLDITEQKRAQEQALQQQAELLHMSRLSTLGEMATELAHELNQPLSAIMTFGGACLRLAQAPSLDRERLLYNQQRVLEQGLRARDVTKRIRAFAARRSLQMAHVPLGELVQSAIKLVRWEMRQKNIELRLSLKDEEVVTDVDAVAITQALVNILRNSIEAIESTDFPSFITLATRVSEAQRAELTVSDRGPGVPDEDFPRLFDPFFTTKPTGLGMGLAISRRIVEMHGGRLWAERNPGGGMTFTMTLPLLPHKTQGTDEVLKREPNR
jgi:two-component system, LuxR family, sensor kinase FixL